MPTKYDQCTDCPKGKYRVPVKDVLPVPVGRFMTLRALLMGLRKGTYAESKGMDICTKCPPGRSSTKGATKAEPVRYLAVWKVSRRRGADTMSRLYCREIFYRKRRRVYSLSKGPVHASVNSVSCQPCDQEPAQPREELSRRVHKV